MKTVFTILFLMLFYASHSQIYRDLVYKSDTEKVLISCLDTYVFYIRPTENGPSYDFNVLLIRGYKIKHIRIKNMSVCRDTIYFVDRKYKPISNSYIILQTFKSDF